MARASKQHNGNRSVGSPVRLRQDLQYASIDRGLHVTYIVKDPVNLQYYEFEDHEIALLRELDNGKSWSDVCEWFNHRFPPLRLTYETLEAMVWRLYEQGLLMTVAAGHGRRVADRAARIRRQQWTQGICQPWAIRLPGFNPSQWLALANSMFGWVFSPVFVGLASIFLVLLLVFIVSQHQTIAEMSPTSVEYFSRQNIVLFGAAIVVTKLLHELGHAIAAYRRGCECHEMGILLLMGLPSLYCDVSDAWMLPNRWRRISISLAGIWVELLVAAVAYVVWTNSVPGLVHAISFNLMLVCSIGTLFFNANPLMRYDGYYVLMDLAGVSNLGQRADESVARLFRRWVLGSLEVRRMDSPEIPYWCVAYGLASALYRIVLMSAILWGLHSALKPFSLEVLVWLTAGVVLSFWGIRMIRMGAGQIRRTLSTGTPLWRVLSGLTAVMSGFVVALTIPLPWYVIGEAVLEPVNVQSVVTTVPGRLLDRKDAGTRVAAGDLVAQLENPDIQRDLQQLENEVRVQKGYLQSLVARRNQDLRAAEQIPAAEAAVSGVEHRLTHLLDQQQRLQLRATGEAVIYPAPPRFENLQNAELANWTGSLLDPINRNAWSSPGDTICQMGAIDRLEAIAILAQDDMEAVAVGQRADLLLNVSGTAVIGEIVRISALELDPKDESTIALVLPESADSRGVRQQNGKWYQIQIRCLSPVPHGTPVRSHCKVRVHAGSRTFGQWITLQFFKTFHWHA